MTTSLDTHVKGPLKASLGIEVSEDEPASSLLNRIWAEPSMDVHGVAGQRFRSPKRHQYDKSLLAEFLGIRCGYAGTGMKTVISSRATAKLSFRLAQGQDPTKMIIGFRQFVEHNTPKGIRTTVQVLTASAAVTVDPNHPAIRVAAQVLESVFGRPADC